MKLVFCLGNPESRYQSTRHNVGFVIGDALASKLAVEWKSSSRHKAHLAESRIGDEKLIIAKPTTYYNNVGQSYQSLISFYNIESSDTLIIHDDIDLEFGTIRTRSGGSGGGSNGIKSLNAHGGDSSYRLRVGIRNELTSRIDSANFVLSRFSKNEAEALTAVVDQAVKISKSFISGDIENTTYYSS